MNYFSEKELACSHCGGYVFDEIFLELLNRIRHDCEFPLPVTSGYRCPEHPIEAVKDRLGAHCSGKAVDIQVSGWKAHRLLCVALEAGIKRIGINQSGPHSQRFIHLDADHDLPYPVIWSY